MAFTSKVEPKFIGPSFWILYVLIATNFFFLIKYWYFTYFLLFLHGLNYFIFLAFIAVFLRTIFQEFAYFNLLLNDINYVADGMNKPRSADRSYLTFCHQQPHHLMHSNYKLQPSSRTTTQKNETRNHPLYFGRYISCSFSFASENNQVVIICK